MFMVKPREVVLKENAVVTIYMINKSSHGSVIANLIVSLTQVI